MPPAVSRRILGTLISLLGIGSADQTAQAAHFQIIADVSGGPQIGAIYRKAIYGTLPFVGSGVLFSLSTSGQYTALHTFNALTDGSAPNARLAIDAKGNLFGTTPLGGANGAGTLWEYSASGVFSTLHSFGAAGDGISPVQGPSLVGRNGIAGTASQGAINDNGNIFSLSEKGDVYSVLYEFQSGTDGHCPFSGLAVGKNGALYGTTIGRGWGGNPNGGVWQFTQSKGLQTLYVFTNGADGEWPDQAPAVDQKGNAFGTTHIQNGSGFAGAVWALSAAGHFSVLHDLNAADDGFGPNSPLLLDAADGNLYGTTASGGTYNDGTVFSISPAGVFKVVHMFTGGTDGANPTGNLIQDSNGKIFGGTAFGSVFMIKP